MTLFQNIGIIQDTAKIAIPIYDLGFFKLLFLKFIIVNNTRIIINNIAYIAIEIGILSDSYPPLYEKTDNNIVGIKYLKSLNINSNRIVMIVIAKHETAYENFHPINPITI